ncbi:ABC transporter ATP-binding protein [Isoptericola sp. b441]|uniref:ABC transporter ATP-binding protein n=1 Tax=Actinotalea lenta TaxID=3064654 RepID=A0ABT9D9B3_9CELL|nr:MULTISPECIES: ABC transporter ATP-binding protein [unclassified Isoptericola]MDO8107492.1 ABC transporter ATP-binding protein [Isoptericola sp. b441]MDO8120848.1 ABC transporter ATP-binding protein [Isoptericola sp. b490]
MSLVASKLVVRYGRHEALAGVNLTAPTGRLTALLGPNGAGKTTLVECTVGLRQPTSGTLEVLGRAPTDRALRTRVGVMLQDGGLPLAAPAGYVLRHVAAMHANPRDLRELSDRLGLGPLWRRPVRRLSGGERQRFALATALVGRPELVLLDEPTAGLDPQARLAVHDLVRELRADGATILLTTHLTHEAAELADHVVVLDAGRVRASGTPQELVGTDRGLRILLDTDPTPFRAELETLLRVPVVASPRLLEVQGTPTPAVLHQVTGWARDRDVRILELAAGHRSLEDVVLALTGRELR